MQSAPDDFDAAASDAAGAWNQAAAAATDQYVEAMNEAITAWNSAAQDAAEAYNEAVGDAADAWNESESTAVSTRNQEVETAVATYNGVMASLQSQANQAYEAYQDALEAAGCGGGGDAPQFQFVAAVNWAKLAKAVGDAVKAWNKSKAVPKAPPPKTPLPKAPVAPKAPTPKAPAVPKAPVKPTKATSPQWQQMKPYRGGVKTNGLNGKERKYYSWDNTHG